MFQYAGTAWLLNEYKRCTTTNNNTLVLPSFLSVRLLVSARLIQPVNSVFLSQRTSTSQPKNQPVNTLITTWTLTLHGGVFLFQRHRRRHHEPHSPWIQEDACWAFYICPVLFATSNLFIPKASRHHADLFIVCLPYRTIPSSNALFAWATFQSWNSIFLSQHFSISQISASANRESHKEWHDGVYQ